MPTPWFLVAGALLIGMALAGSVLKRLPLTASMFYLGAGALLGPWGADLLRVDAVRDARLVERLTEVVVIVALFTAGLKLRLPISDWRWRPAVLLAVVAMIFTTAAVAAIAWWGLGLSWALAVAAGAVLAPTDPVLASDVQVAHEHDDEPLRFNLTAEAGLNDGTAFPFVMLALGMFGVHELGAWGWRWVAMDVAWAVSAGLGVGVLCGSGVGRLVIYLRREHREAVGLDEFLALGVIALSYGLAQLVSAYGFLAVFAAGLAVRRIERLYTEVAPPADVVQAAGAGEEAATHRHTAAAFMARAVLGFNEQIERVGELVVVVAVGAMLAGIESYGTGAWVALLLFTVVRPVTTLVALAPLRLSRPHRAFIGWFGVRGVGSIYYLTYAITHGLPDVVARTLADICLIVVAASIVVHGVSVTPLMNRYKKWSPMRYARFRRLTSPPKTTARRTRAK